MAQFGLFIVAFFVAVAVNAAEPATFESFYKEGTDWVFWGISVAGATIGVAIVFLTGGTALFAALSFGGAVGLDYGIDRAVSTYEYNNLTEQSENMSTLPLPKIPTFIKTRQTINQKVNEALNDDSVIELYDKATEFWNDISDGEKKSIEKENKLLSEQSQTPIKLYDKAMAILDDIPDDEKENIGKENAPLSETSREQINKSIEEVLKGLEKSDEPVKNKSLLALLYFISNDYQNAKNWAHEAISSAKKAKVKATLPEFIFAVSMLLYEDKFDFEESISRLQRATFIESENPLTPLLFSIYLDRMALRFQDGYLSERDLLRVFEVMKADELESFGVMEADELTNWRAANYVVLLTRYFQHLKSQEQTIKALAHSMNEKIRQSPKMLRMVQDAFGRYGILLEGAHEVMTDFEVLDFDDEEQQALRLAFRKTLENYIYGENELASTIEYLKSYQKNNN